MKTIIQKPILRINSEHLPSEIIADILGDAEIEHLEVYDGNTAHFNDPIKIEDLRFILDKLEAHGANYVSIDFHTDHQELELDGIFITTATPEEIIFYEQKDKDFQTMLIRDMIKDYKKSLDQFKNKLKELTGDE